jgi:sucrose-6-phosphate hydrolase SacC (GH32 family)
MKNLFNLNPLKLSILSLFFGISLHLVAQEKTEQWRPQIHFSPQKNWTNDPNGLLYFKGYYHLFFQHNPKGNEWGNMSWGHARTKDLMHWEELPVAIPNGKEYIFSGCVVWDKQHVSGLGDPSKDLLIAIYTADYPYTREEQHLAYSNDDGLTWTKYTGNPILNINYKDFRDPNIIWHEESNQFVMVVAKPFEFKISFYGSKDLLHWNFLSDFGNEGDVDMIWECPSLQHLPIDGSKEMKWVLFVSSQGPYKDFVGMQYFVGDFNGKKFTNDNPVETKLYVDHGKDFYAAVPFYNAPQGQNLWLGWMLSWKYAKEQPTFPWKGQMSAVRKLDLVETGEGLRLHQKFVPELDRKSPSFVAENISIQKDKSKQLNGLKFLKDKTYAIDLKVSATRANFWGIVIKGRSNKEDVRIGFDEKAMKWQIDRDRSGNILTKDFKGIQEAKAIIGHAKNFKLLIDRSTIELLAQDGTVAISSLRFPKEDLEDVFIVSEGGATVIRQLKIWELK